MSNSAVTITINAFPNAGETNKRYQMFMGTFSISAGNYYTGGMALNWALEPIKTQPLPPAPVNPPLVWESSNSANYSGYTYWVDSAGNLHVGSGNNNNGTNPTPAAELGNNTVTPTAVVDAQISFMAWFLKD